MDTSIRLCTMDGLPELRNLSINTFYETFAPMNTAEDMENYLATSFDEAKFRRELSDSNTDFFFVYSGEELAGYMLNEAPSQSDVNDKTSLEIERIYILLKYQGEGLGALLMDKAISTARERGKEYIWLGV
ncbi:MAG: GNAT family N-acetyltransferase [Oscillospiraceae bacterium]